MDHQYVIQGERIGLRYITLDDVTPEYVSWLNDKTVNQFLEIRFEEHTLESVNQFVRQMRNTPGEYLMAICLLDGDRHIGNIKIGSVNTRHRFGVLSLFIGNRQYWGQGIGAEAIGLMTSFAFTTLGLHKINSKAYFGNLSSIYAFRKCGYAIEGVEQEQYLHNGIYCDACMMGIVNRAKQ